MIEEMTLNFHEVPSVSEPTRKRMWWNCSSSGISTDYNDGEQLSYLKPLIAFLKIIVAKDMIEKIAWGDSLLKLCFGILEPF